MSRSIGGDDLRTVVGVDLVAVVLRRVVRCGDHDAGGRAEVLHGEREHRRRQRPRHEPRVEPGGGEDRGGVAGEVGGPVPRVEADDDRPADRTLPASHAASPAAARRTTVRFMPFGPARSGPRSPAVPKVERPAEPVGELGVVAGVEQRLQFGGGRRVDLVLDPGLDLAAAHHSLQRPRRCRSRARCNRRPRSIGRVRLVVGELLA